MDIPVQFLIDKLWGLVEYRVDLISNAKGELAGLTNELRVLKALLKGAPTKYKKDDLFKEWERQVRETICKVEDTIDTSITEVAMEKDMKNMIKKGISKVNRASLAEQVRSARKIVQDLFDTQSKMFIPNLTAADKFDTSGAETREIRQKKRQTKIVGVQDQADTLIGYLNEKVDRLDVVSIIGMPGLGKTTVAWKIFQDPKIKYEFPIRVWVNISEDPNPKKVLITMLSELGSQVNTDKLSIDDLVEKVKEHLNSGKYLIVMDDVWTKDAWDELKTFLPQNNTRGKVLITSREEKVASHANVYRRPHRLRFLTKPESWELLQHEVYEDVNVIPEELAQVGQLISDGCDGLPLSIVVIGGVLKDKISEAHGAVSLTKVQWEEVCSSIQTYLAGDKLEKIIRLSYEKLPYDLRDCFLYLGVFPEDADIPAKKLTLLWMGEGFIQSANGKSLEDIAHAILKDLINRNLLMVEKEKMNGEAKICRVHDTIRAFCRAEAKYDNLNLYQEITLTNHGVLDPPIENAGNYRRICIHSSINTFFKEKPKIHNARTFLCYPKSPTDLDANEIAPVTEAFNLLRVLDAQNIKFPKFPQKLLKLYHLRYLTLAFSKDDVKSLPAVMSNLWNLQTLIVETKGRKLDIHADIWMMRHLRHLKTKASIVLKNVGKGKGGDNLQTLERLSPESCLPTVFNKARNLVKLGIQGDLSSLLEASVLEKLDRLSKLKLVHVVQNADHVSKRALLRLPVATKFPPNLKTLVLASTYLKWQQMPVLGTLGSLKALKLKENAFSGDAWTAGTGGFLELEFLDIERSDVVFWTANEDSFPDLRFLTLKSCETLKEVPFKLGKKIEVLYLERVTNTVVSSARKIKATKADLVLKIAPADDTPVVPSDDTHKP